MRKKGDQPPKNLNRFTDRPDGDQQNQQNHQRGSRGKRPSVQNKEGLKRMNFLYQASHLMLQLTEDPSLSRFYIHNMKRISNKLTQRMDSSVKRTLCKYCDAVLIPGLTSKVRVQSEREQHIVVECIECGTIKRFLTRTSETKQQKRDRKRKQKQERKSWLLQQQQQQQQTATGAETTTTTTTTATTTATITEEQQHESNKAAAAAAAQPPLEQMQVEIEDEEHQQQQQEQKPPASVADIGVPDATSAELPQAIIATAASSTAASRREARIAARNAKYNQNAIYNMVDEYLSGDIAALQGEPFEDDDNIDYVKGYTVEEYEFSF